MHVALGIMQYDRTPADSADADRGLRHGDACCIWSPAGASARATAAARLTADGWLAVGPPDVDPRQGRAHRHGAGRRAHRGVPRRRRDRRADQSLRAPERPARRRPHHRRLRHLPVARLPVPAGGRLRAAAVHREARDLPRAAQATASSRSIRRRCRPARRRRSHVRATAVSARFALHVYADRRGGCHGGRELDRHRLDRGACRSAAAARHGARTASSRCRSRTAGSAWSRTPATTSAGRSAKAGSTATTSSAPGTTGNSTAAPARASPASRRTRCRPTR